MADIDNNIFFFCPFFRGNINKKNQLTEEYGRILQIIDKPVLLMQCRVYCVRFFSRDSWPSINHSKTSSQFFFLYPRIYCRTKEDLKSMHLQFFSCLQFIFIFKIHPLFCHRKRKKKISFFLQRKYFLFSCSVSCFSIENLFANYLGIFVLLVLLLLLLLLLSLSIFLLLIVVIRK